MMIKGPNQPAVNMTVIGTGGGEVRAVTQRGSPNVMFQIVGPVTALSVRFGHEFLVAFSGAVGIDAMGWVNIGGFREAALVGAGTALLGLAKNAVTIFSRLAKKYPLISGEV